MSVTESRAGRPNKYTWSKATIIRALRRQIERDGGKFLRINMKKESLHYLDNKGNKIVEKINYE